MVSSGLVVGAITNFQGKRSCNDTTPRLSDTKKNARCFLENIKRNKGV